MVNYQRTIIGVPSRGVPMNLINLKLGSVTKRILASTITHRELSVGWRDITFILYPEMTEVEQTLARLTVTGIFRCENITLSLGDTDDYFRFLRQFIRAEDIELDRKYQNFNGVKSI